MPFPDSMQAMLDDIRDFPIGRIYVMASREAIEEGFRLVRGEAVSRFFPSDREAGVLVAAIQSGRARFVDLLSEDGRVLNRCSICQPEALPRLQGCAHSVCALITLKLALSETTSATVPPLGEAYRNRLRAGLLSEPQEVPTPRDRLAEGRRKRPPEIQDRPVAATCSDTGFPTAIIIEQDDAGRGRVWLRLDGRNGSATPINRVSPDLRPFSHGYAAGPKLRHLCRSLSEGQLYGVPVVHREKGTETELRWAPDARCGTRVEFERFDDFIEIRHVAVCPTTRLLGMQFAVDLAAGTLHPVSEDAGSALWGHLSETFDGPADDFMMDDLPLLQITVPLDELDRAPIDIPQALAERLPDAAFLVAGKTVSPFPGQAVSETTRWTVDLKELPGGKEVALVLGGHAREGMVLPDPLFAFLDARNLAPGFRTAKRAAAIRNAFFAAVAAAPKDRIKAIRAEIDPYVTGRSNRTSVVSYIRKTLDKSSQKAILLHFDDDGKPSLLASCAATQTDVYRAAAELFGTGIFRKGERFGTMIVGTAAFHAGAAAFLERLRIAGATFRFGGAPVVPVTLDIRVDAAAGGLDWFELRPEIRWNGEPVDDAIWKAMLEGPRFVTHGHETFLLDDRTLETIRLLAGVLPGVASPSDRKPRTVRDVVRVPRLRILELLALRRLGVTVALPEAEEAVFRRLSEFERIDARALPVGLLARLRPYQHEGYSWLVFLYENRFGALLADDMGLGKTVQAISLLGAIKEGLIDARVPESAPHLVVAPPSLLFNWECEIRRFLPAARVRVYHGKDREVDFRDADIVLTSYDLVRRDLEKLSEQLFDVIVFDEAQVVKNLHAGTTGAVRRLRGAFKLALTGTPMENRAEEYFAIMDLVVPGLHDDPAAMRNRLRKEDAPALSELRRRSRPFVLRRTKDKILSELPPKIETDVFLELSDRQRAMYHKMADEARRTIERAYAEKTEHQARIIALTALLRLRQICLSPALLSPDERPDSPKLAFLVEMLRELDEAGHSALIFSQFTSFLDLAERALSDAGLDHIRLDGSTPVAERRKRVDAFQEGTKPGRFLLSLKAGGRGLNLTRAEYVFHLDPWWNPAVEDQASDRAHRIGQANKVTVTRLLMRHTLEEKMTELKRRKRALFLELLEDGGGSGGAAIGREDFDFLLGGQHHYVASPLN